MKSPKTRPRLARMPDALLPLALLAYSALRPRAVLALRLYAAQFAVAAASLFASRGMRLAFARQPSMRGVRGSVKCALLLTILGASICVGATYLFPYAVDAGALSLIAAGVALNIEHIFYEYMYAIGDSGSASLSRGIAALLTFAGLQLAGSGADAHTRWLAVTTGLSALAAAAVGIATGGAKGRLNARIFRDAPRAALQSALYPAVAVCTILLLRPERFSAAFFAGMALYELCRTPFRRSPQEAKPLNNALLTVFSASVLLFLLKQFQTMCAMLAVASACAFVLFGNISGNE